MKNPVKKITDLCRYLPIKDQFYADAFIIRRDFVSLKELVDSDCKKVEKNYGKAVPNEELLNINIDKLRELSVELDNYLEILGEILEPVDDDDYLNEIEEDEW